MSALTIWGFSHLAGQTVSAFIGGLDAGDYLVAADGSISVTTQSDPDGLLTETYLLGLNGPDYGEIAASIVLNGFDLPVTVSVPVAVGLAYVTRGQLLRPTLESEIKSPQGPGLAKSRRVYQIGALLNNTIGVYTGTDFGSSLYPLPRPGADGTALNNTIPFTGVAWGPLQDTYSFDGMITWQIKRPYPCTICAIAGFVEVEDR